MNTCDRCGKRIKSGTLCPICNAYVEGYVQGAKAEEKVALNKFADWFTKKGFGCTHYGIGCWSIFTSIEQYRKEQK